MVGCDTGYSLSHAAGTARECQDDGTWSGSTVTCAGIPCTVNTAIANSDRTASNPCVAGTGNDCIFACDGGFHVQGVHSCGSDGTLSGGSCERNACTGGLTLDDSPTTCAGVFEDECRYTCDSGMSATTPHVCGADGAFSGGACEPCSGVLQEMLDWLETDSSMFSFCPTADIKPYQGMRTVKVGKELFIDGSGGPGGTVRFNGDFRANARGVGAATLINLQLVPSTAVWVAGANNFGALGLGDTVGPRKSLELLPSPSNVVQIAASLGQSYHSVFLAQDGTVRLARCVRQLTAS